MFTVYMTSGKRELWGLLGSGKDAWGRGGTNEKFWRENNDIAQGERVENLESEGSVWKDPLL